MAVSNKGKKIKTPKADKNVTAKKPTPVKKGKDELVLQPVSGDCSGLERSKVSQIVDTLLTIHNSKPSDGKSKTSQLFGEEETPVHIQIAGIKLPKESRQQLIKITYPHTTMTDVNDVCLIVKDLEKGLKVDHEPTVNHFKELLSDKGVEVSRVMSLRELKVEYKTYESKTALCHSHEAFFADERIMRLLPKFLGNAFYKRKKFPMAVNLKATDLKKEFEKVAHSVVLPLSHKGTCAMMRVGHTSMKPSFLVDNILRASEVLAKRYPGGFKNIRSLSLKTETSMALPLHVSLTSANDLGFVDSDAPAKRQKMSVTDELSTILNAQVTVNPDGSVRVKGGAKENLEEDFQDGSDVDEEKDSEDEEQEEAKSAKKKRKTSTKK